VNKILLIHLYIATFMLRYPSSTKVHHTSIVITVTLGATGKLLLHGYALYTVYNHSTNYIPLHLSKTKNIEIVAHKWEVNKEMYGRKCSCNAT
jgi:hypothetical protein